MKKPRKRTPRADGLATRRRLLSAATEMFSAAGYEATSLRQIAAAASVDLATLKYHYGDKPALFAEVYRVGHQSFLDLLTPFLEGIDAVEDADQMRAEVRVLVSRILDFFEANRSFTRLVLYRLLEDSSDVIDAEEELQGIALALIESAFDGLIERQIIRPIDVRALITLMVSSFSMWFVTCEVKPRWIGEPQPGFSGPGRDRAEAFFYEFMERFLF